MRDRRGRAGSERWLFVFRFPLSNFGSDFAILHCALSVLLTWQPPTGLEADVAGHHTCCAIARDDVEVQTEVLCRAAQSQEG